MTKLSPSTAAKAWKVGKSTIYKLMNEGQLSFELDESQKRVIDPSEMMRVFGEPKKSETNQKTVHDDSDRIADLKEAMARQERQQQEYVQTLKDQITSQQKQLDSMTEAVDRITRLLEKQPAPAATPAPEPIQPPAPTPEPAPQPQQQAKRKTLFGRLLSAAIND